jgi:hypothetical protein
MKCSICKVLLGTGKCDQCHDVSVKIIIGSAVFFMVAVMLLAAGIL